MTPLEAMAKAYWNDTADWDFVQDDVLMGMRRALLALAEVTLPQEFYDASASAAIAAKDDEEPEWILGTEMQSAWFKSLLLSLAAR